MPLFLLFVKFTELMSPLCFSTSVVLLLTMPIVFFSVVVCCEYISNIINQNKVTSHLKKIYFVTEFYDIITLYLNVKSNS